MNLKPHDCHWCRASSRYLAVLEDNGSYAVYCVRCGAKGPNVNPFSHVIVTEELEKRIEELAILKWNSIGTLNESETSDPII